MQEITPSAVSKHQEKACDTEEGGSLQKETDITTRILQGQGCGENQIQLSEIQIKVTKKVQGEPKDFPSANHNKWLSNTKCQLALEAQWMARQKMHF